MNDTQKTLLGFVAGIAVGAGLYAFLKSDKGKEMVNDLKNKADKWKADFDDLVEKGKQMAEDMRSDAEGETVNT